MTHTSDAKIDTLLEQLSDMILETRERGTREGTTSNLMNALNLMLHTSAQLSMIKQELKLHEQAARNVGDGTNASNSSVEGNDNLPRNEHAAGDTP